MVMMTIKMIINNDNGGSDNNDDTDVKDCGVNDKNNSYHEISGNEDEDDNDNNLEFLDFSNHVARFLEI